eukprot:14817484-Alexandrium_andersonii.AAC.1
MSASLVGSEMCIRDRGTRAVAFVLVKLPIIPVLRDAFAEARREPTESSPPGTNRRLWPSPNQTPVSWRERRRCRPPLL